ncbi:MAG: phosphonate ABC transporter ATP-binding protein [Bacillota bacterium]
MQVVQAINITKIYPNGTVGLGGLTVSVTKGEMVGIMGPSGSGKTTFFRLINGSILPTAGSLVILGQEIGKISLKFLRRLRARIAVIPQNYNVVPELSVAHNIIMGQLGWTPLLKSWRQLFYLNQEEKMAVQQVLERLEMAEKFSSLCRDLSGGQQQRVAIARALVGNPELVLADEPIASVDLRTAEIILNLFKELHEQGTTVLLNLHQQDFALRYCSRVLVLSQGKLVFDGPPEDLPNHLGYGRPHESVERKFQVPTLNSSQEEDSYIHVP